MNLKDLKEYIEFMNENNLAEIELEDKGTKIRLKKDSAHAPIAISAMPHTMMPSMPAAVGAPAAAKAVEGGIEIKSPMVGTFYRSPSPGAKPYIEVGDTIKPGDVLCIVEAMKLMNEIKAEVAGKIIKITGDNGEPVEFGQVLFVIEPL